MKKKVHDFLNKNRWFIKSIYALIILSVIAIIADSFPAYRAKYHDKLHLFEVIAVIIFTIEYIVRIWCADYDASNFKESVKHRLKFIFSFYGIIDLVAILPFFLPLIFSLDIMMVRALRLLRLLRIFKLGRYSKSMKLISHVLQETKSELLVTLFVCSILVVLSATLMYHIESHAQPEAFEHIGHSLWWSVATLTTVGYGDITPITPMGRFLGAVIALIGIGFVALPTGIISSVFISKINEDRQTTLHITCTCPNCKTEFEMDIHT